MEDSGLAELCTQGLWERGRGAWLSRRNQSDFVEEVTMFSTVFSDISICFVTSWVKKMGVENQGWLGGVVSQDVGSLLSAYVGGQKPNPPLIWMLFSPPLSMLSLCLFELSPSIWSP